MGEMETDMAQVGPNNDCDEGLIHDPPMNVGQTKILKGMTDKSEGVTGDE